MKELKYYLSGAREYDDGHQAVERLVSIYTHAPQKAETLWQEAIDAYQRAGLLEDFEKALAENGLFVQYDNLRSKFHSIEYDSEVVGEMYFTLRVYSYSPIGYAAVLKLVIPKSDHFIDVRK